MIVQVVNSEVMQRCLIIVEIFHNIRIELTNLTWSSLDSKHLIGQRCMTTLSRGNDLNPGDWTEVHNEVTSELDSDWTEQRARKLLGATGRTMTCHYWNGGAENLDRGQPPRELNEGT